VLYPIRLNDINNPYFKFTIKPIYIYIYIYILQFQLLFIVVEAWIGTFKMVNMLKQSLTIYSAFVCCPPKSVVVGQHVLD